MTIVDENKPVCFRFKHEKSAIKWAMKLMENVVHLYEERYDEYDYEQDPLIQTYFRLPVREDPLSPRKRIYKRDEFTIKEVWKVFEQQIKIKLCKTDQTGKIEYLPIFKD